MAPGWMTRRSTRRPTGANSGQRRTQSWARRRREGAGSVTDQDRQPLRRLRQGGTDVQKRMNAEFPVEFRLQWDMLNAYLRGLQTDPATTMVLGEADGTKRLLAS